YPSLPSLSPPATRHPRPAHGSAPSEHRGGVRALLRGVRAVAHQPAGVGQRGLLLGGGRRAPALRAAGPGAAGGAVSVEGGEREAGEPQPRRGPGLDAGGHPTPPQGGAAHSPSVSSAPLRRGR
ncbi:unnamed protein product, partial [Prorocentrum cordatum]